MKRTFSKPQYLLDECLAITDEERKSGLYIPFNEFAYGGLIDDVLLERATNAGLAIITVDKGMVLRAITYGINIVYQNKWGQRYYVYGSKTEYLGKVMNHNVPKKSNLQKKKELIASITSPRISISGLDTTFCI